MWFWNGERCAHLVSCDLTPDTVPQPALLAERALLPSSGAHSDLETSAQELLPHCDDLFGSVSF